MPGNEFQSSLRDLDTNTTQINRKPCINIQDSFLKNPHTWNIFSNWTKIFSFASLSYCTQYRRALKYGRVLHQKLWHFFQKYAPNLEHCFFPSTKMWKIETPKHCGEKLNFPFKSKSSQGKQTPTEEKPKPKQNKWKPPNSSNNFHWKVILMENFTIFNWWPDGACKAVYNCIQPSQNSTLEMQKSTKKVSWLLKMYTHFFAPVQDDACLVTLTGWNATET